MKSHEDGDLDKINSVFFDEYFPTQSKRGEDSPRIHQALAVCRALGRRPLATEYRHLFNIRDRERTYGHHWPGPDARVMALAGFLQHPNNDKKAVCAFCQLECSWWHSGEDPMERHRVLSPNCRHLKCLKMMGPWKHHCDISFYILTR